MRFLCQFFCQRGEKVLTLSSFPAGIENAQSTANSSRRPCYEILYAQHRLGVRTNRSQITERVQIPYRMRVWLSFGSRTPELALLGIGFAGLGAAEVIRRRKNKYGVAIGCRSSQMAGGLRHLHKVFKALFDRLSCYLSSSNVVWRVSIVIREGL